MGSLLTSAGVKAEAGAHACMHIAGKIRVRILAGMGACVPLPFPLPRPASELSDGEVELGSLAPGAFSDRILAPLRAALTAAPGCPEAGEAEAEACATLAALEGWLGEHEVDFIGGDDPDATDCYLGPKLLHAALALRDLRGRSLPGERVPHGAAASSSCYHA